MSFVITLYVREGIVMAADSRLTLNVNRTNEDGRQIALAVTQSDSNTKLFRAPGGIGLSISGAAAIDGVPLAGYVESFILEHINIDTDVADVPQRLLDEFGQYDPRPQTTFHVAGYAGQEQLVWVVNVGNETIQQVNPTGKQGATWSGEGDILTRLIQPVEVVGGDGSRQQLPYHQIPWNFFTLQDAIDFAVFALRSTIDAIRFQPRPKTVGGPIDVLVIKPDGAFWVQHKELHGQSG